MGSIPWNRYDALATVLYSWSDLEEKNGTREKLKREIILSFLHDANMTIDEIDSAFVTVNILSSYD